MYNSEQYFGVGFSKTCLSVCLAKSKINYFSYNRTKINSLQQNILFHCPAYSRKSRLFKNRLISKKSEKYGKSLKRGCVNASKNFPKIFFVLLESYLVNPSSNVSASGPCMPIQSHPLHYQQLLHNFHLRFMFYTNFGEAGYRFEVRNRSESQCSVS